MQPGFSNMQPTPGYKGNEPAHGDPLSGDTTPLAARRSVIKRLIALLSRGRSHPKA